MEERKTVHAAVDHRSSGEQYYVPIVYGSQTNPLKQYDQPNHKNHQFLDQPNPNTQQYADQYLERTPDEIEKALYRYDPFSFQPFCYLATLSGETLSGEIFVGQNYSSGKIFITKRKIHLQCL